MPFLEDSEILQSDENTLTCSVKRGEPVMVSFFGLPSIGQIKNPHKSDDNGLKVASLLDLAGTKVATVQQRATFKDYVDIATIIENGDIDLPTAISAAQLIYGQQFNPQITLKALSYFKDITNLSKHHQNVLLEAVTKTDLDKLPDLRPVKNFVKRDNGL